MAIWLRIFPVLYGPDQVDQVQPTGDPYNVRPRSIVKLVQITPITMVNGAYNYSYCGESKPTYNWGGPHCMEVS